MRPARGPHGDLWLDCEARGKHHITFTRSFDPLTGVVYLGCRRCPVDTRRETAQWPPRTAVEGIALAVAALPAHRRDRLLQVGPRVGPACLRGG